MADTENINPATGKPYTPAELAVKKEKDKKALETSSRQSIEKGIENKNKDPLFKEGTNVDTTGKLIKVGDKWLDEKQHKHWMGIESPVDQNNYLDSIKNDISDEEAEALNKKTPAPTKDDKIGAISQGSETLTEEQEKALKEAEKNQKEEDDSFNKAKEKAVKTGKTSASEASESKPTIPTKQTDTGKIEADIKTRTKTGMDEMTKDYTNLSIQDILNRNDFGKEVEDAVRSNYENEGWLSNAWTKKAGRVKDQIKDAESRLKAAETPEEKAAIEKEIKDLKEEKSNINSKYGYFLVDAIRTGLQNVAIPGKYGHGPGNKQSLWDKEVNKNLEADLNRHNKAMDNTVQNMIDGLSTMYDVDSQQIKSANALLNNRIAEIQASKLGILKDMDKFNAAVNIQQALGEQDFTKVVAILTLMGKDPAATALVQGADKTGEWLKTLFGNKYEEEAE